MLKKLNSGQIALPLVLLVSGIIIEIVAAGAFVTYFASGVSYGGRLGAKAYEAAYGGLNDALIKVARDKYFGYSNPSYELSMEGSKAIVSFNSNTSGNYFVYDIFSIGQAGSYKVKIHAVLIVEKESGIVSLQMVEELPAGE